MEGRRKGQQATGSEQCLQDDEDMGNDGSLLSLSKPSFKALKLIPSLCFFFPCHHANMLLKEAVKS